MNQNDDSFQPETEGENKPASDSIDQRSGGIYFENNQSVTIKGDVIHAEQVYKTTNIDLVTLFSSYRRWLRDTLRLDDIPPHLNTSWVGRSIYVMNQLGRGVTAHHWWALIGSLTLWVASIWLITPILRWPLDDVTARGQACLLYAVGTLVVPFFVTLTTPVDRFDDIKLETRRARLRFWFLKLIGAYTGFALAAGAIGVALIAYYLGWTLPRPVQWLLALLALFFSHLGARRIPGDRLQMYDEMRLHDADRLVVVVFLLLGPGVAAFIYFGYPVIANPGMGLLVMIAFSGLALWEVRKRQSIVLADWALIAIYGLLLPLVLVVAIFLFAMPSVSPTAYEWWVLALAAPYFLGFTLLGATTFVRNPPTLTLRGMLGLLFVLLAVAYVLSVNLWVGRWLLIAIVLLWSLWGRRAWRRYLWLHPSFWWMLVAVGGAVYLGRQGEATAWLNVLGFSILALMLISWAYQHHRSW